MSLQRSESAFLESAAARHPVFLGVMAHVEAMFGQIRDGVIAYGLSNCVRATLLQPISSLSTKQVCAQYPRCGQRPTCDAEV